MKAIFDGYSVVFSKDRLKNLTMFSPWLNLIVNLAKIVFDFVPFHDVKMIIQFDLIQ